MIEKHGLPDIANLNYGFNEYMICMLFLFT